jgi:hypothetical protein
MNDRTALAIAASDCLKRAAGQHGRLTLSIRLPPNPGQPCNPATMFELIWAVSEHGGLHVQLAADTVIVAETTI